MRLELFLEKHLTLPRHKGNLELIWSRTQQEPERTKKNDVLIFGLSFCGYEQYDRGKKKERKQWVSILGRV